MYSRKLQKQQFKELEQKTFLVSAGKMKYPYAWVLESVCLLTPPLPKNTVSNWSLSFTENFSSLLVQKINVKWKNVKNGSPNGFKTLEGVESLVL